MWPGVLNKPVCTPVIRSNYPITHRGQVTKHTLALTLHLIRILIHAQPIPFTALFFACKSSVRWPCNPYHYMPKPYPTRHYGVNLKYGKLVNAYPYWFCIVMLLLYSPHIYLWEESPIYLLNSTLPFTCCIYIPSHHRDIYMRYFICLQLETSFPLSRIENPSSTWQCKRDWRF